MAGWRAGGVAPTAKHFPGLGGAKVNTDDAPVTIRRARAKLDGRRHTAVRGRDPRGRAARDGLHARYPALDAGASPLSRERSSRDCSAGELGYRGVVVTDSMEAAASLATGPITATSERAVRAGADLLLLTGRGCYRPVYEHLLAKARHSASFRQRVREAAARVLALKAGL